jgi:hypothetical protein
MSARGTGVRVRPWPNLSESVNQFRQISWGNPRHSTQSHIRTVAWRKCPKKMHSLSNPIGPAPGLKRTYSACRSGGASSNLPDAGSRPDPAAVQAQSDGNTRQFQTFDTEHQIATCRWRDRPNNKSRQQIKVLPDSTGALIHPRSGRSARCASAFLSSYQ